MRQAAARPVARNLLRLVILAASHAALLAQAPPEVANFPHAALLAPPPEVANFRFTGQNTLAWNATAGADFYNVYRGRAADLRAGTPPQCHAYQVVGTTFTAAQNPPAPRDIFVYLVTAESEAGEGTAGLASSGAPRVTRGSCGPVVQGHVMNRTGFGWGEWSSSRIQTLGIQGYIDEQLDPASIDESDNVALNSRMALHDPPAAIYGLVSRQLFSAIYGRRQLEQEMTAFWANHFNTHWQKPVDFLLPLYSPCSESPGPSCDPNFPQILYREATATQHHETEKFRHLAFNGTFREIVEASARSAAMIVFLDSFKNINGSPNENYARELLELYTMGVDGGYTQRDVEELARILTGWTICKKSLADVDNPTAPCIANYWEPAPAGRWVAHFDMSYIEPGIRRHDCGAKVLFEDTPYETHFPATPCVSPQEGVDELDAALDAIVAHPSTPRYIVKKILQQLVADNPSAVAIDALLEVWYNHPDGVGVLREVTRAALQLPEFRSPDQAGSKIKAPFEQFVAAMRATRGSTNGLSLIFNYLATAQQLPYCNAIPTGYPETGPEWIDTHGTLTRQSFGLVLSARADAAFGSDPIGLLSANGVSPVPGNEAAIVDFFAKILFAGAISPADRQAAITFLSTNDVGVVSPLDTTRIRDTVGLMLGYPQFQEQ